MRGRWLTWAPLALFAALALIFMTGLLKPEDSIVSSKMVGKHLPTFSLPAAATGVPALSNEDFKTGKPHLLNIFASWCVPCAAEAPQLARLAEAGVPIEGVAIRDAREDVDAFLKRNGNPYRHIGLDARSEVQIAIGSSGVPETFVIDGTGHIIHQHIGEIRPEHVSELLAIWKAAE